MNRNDNESEEVRSYVRDRMPDDLPPDFIGELMTDVQRTPQRRRGWGGWPVLAGLGTIAAAAALMIIVLPMFESDGVGAGPTPSVGASTSVDATASPAASDSPSTAPSESASEAPTDEPTGEFGPVWSMTGEEAFGADATSCENPGAITTTGDQTDTRYAISMPGDWYANAAAGTWAACTLFAPEAFEVRSDGTYPESVEIVANMPPGGDFVPSGSTIETKEYTVDGVAAVRYALAPEEGGFSNETTVVWIIAINGRLPEVGNDMPFLAVSTASADPDELAIRSDVLDRMIATLDILE